MIEVPEGTTVLEAARKIGVSIPTLCYYEAIKPYGGCRLCLVEVTQGNRTQLTASCTYPVAEGLKVLTDTEEVLEGRRLVIDLLWSRCPDVPVLRDLAQQLGVAEPSFPKGDSDCILCGKCVRVCHDLQNVGAIGLMGRGAKRQVTTPFGEFSEVCRTCGACSFVCPTGHYQDIGKISGKTPKPRYNEFNSGLDTRGNIYRLYPQAVPSAPAIDAQNCVKMLTGDCGVCSQVCGPGAIDYTQEKQETTLEVGSVILAPGFKPFDPAAAALYGYGKYPNVHTSLEFERILSPAGPFHGHVIRRSDGREPKKIAWIHCVGSRSLHEDAKAYCSNFCCMASLKQAIVAREHLGPDLDMALFYLDLRTPRKDFEKYAAKIRDQGARMIRSRVHSVKPAPSDGDLEIRYVTEPGQVVDEVFDMVVLSVGMVMPPSTLELARRLKVPLGPNDFMEASCFAPTTSFRDGNLCLRRLYRPQGHPPDGDGGKRRGRHCHPAPGLGPGHPDEKERIPPGKRGGGGTGPGGGFRLQLRPQHRRSGRRPGHRGIRQVPSPGGVRPGQPVHLLPGLPGADGGVDPGAPTEPGGGGGLQPHHSPTHLPGDDANRRR